MEKPFILQKRIGGMINRMKKKIQNAIFNEKVYVILTILLLLCLIIMIIYPLTGIQLVSQVGIFSYIIFYIIYCTIYFKIIFHDKYL